MIYCGVCGRNGKHQFWSGPDTIRHEIMAALKGQILTAKDIPPQISISEKEVYGHLEHIQKSLGGMHGLLIITR
ncbi:MAG: hypothetical protein M0018_10965 [Nitrospiraceae bacterium]|nr:hypothetical protein [Nitrospiraceae bacterium]